MWERKVTMTLAMAALSVSLVAQPVFARSMPLSSSQFVVTRGGETEIEHPEKHNPGHQSFRSTRRGADDGAGVDDGGGRGRGEDDGPGHQSLRSTRRGADDGAGEDHGGGRGRGDDDTVPHFRGRAR